MKIRFLTDGVLLEEQQAFAAIERAFPRDWLGFAGFQLMQRGAQPLDIDLVMLTSNRILVVELKNWQGSITFADQMWVHGRRATRSPVHLTNYKSKILLDLLKQKVSKTVHPKIDPLVVLCHPTSNPILPELEMQHVMLLDAFCELGRDSNSYKRRYPDTPPDRRQPSANPLPNSGMYDLFFAPGSGHIGKRRFAVQGFEQLRVEADYVHPNKVYSEYEAQDQESKRSKALLRRWDFNHLANGNTTITERCNIALRETRINEAIRLHSPELHKDLLGPVGRPTAEDVVTHFSEAYRLEERFERLSEHLSGRGSKLSHGERTSLVKILLARFANLHSMGIAHRDITANSLWIQSPSRIVLSSFATAYFPEQLTVGLHRVELEKGAIRLPEDERSAEGSSPFRRDVFLLGALAYEVVFGRALDCIEGVPLLDDADECSGLSSWFIKALDWSPSARFKDAAEALDAWNTLTLGVDEQVVSKGDLEAFATEASPTTLQPEQTLKTIQGKWIYRSSVENSPVVVKLWTGLNFDENRASRNRRLFTFLETARKLQQSTSSDHPSVVDYGMGPFGLVLVTKWIEGQTLSDWAAIESPAEVRASVARELALVILRLHGLGIAHGDLKPENIVVVATEGRPQLTVIDIPDLQADGDLGITLAFVPSHLPDASPHQRDLFAAASIVRMLLEPHRDQFPNAWAECLRALERPEEGCPVSLIADEIQRELAGTRKELIEFEVTHRGTELTDDLLIGDNERFPVNIVPGPRSGETYFYILGVSHQIRITVDSSERVTGTWVMPVSHVDYIRNVARSTLSLHCRIRVRWAQTENASTLVSHLRNISTQGVIVSDDDLIDEESEQITDLTPTPASGVVTARKLWSALVAFEEETLTRVTLRDGAEPDPDDSMVLVVPYDLDSGAIEYAPDEEVELLGRRYDPATGLQRWSRVATVDVDRTSDSVLAIRIPKRRRLEVHAGTVYGIRGRQDRIAAERRRFAMRRILEDRSVMRGLPEYFDDSAAAAPVEFPLPSGLDLSSYKLNPEQTDAFLSTLSKGPVGLLQGPPGTGKTKFIASLVHCLLSRKLAENVLLVSQSHEAINHALKKVSELSEESEQKFSIVRVGRTGRRDGQYSTLGNLHESAQQQAYRERFAAELKPRVQAAAFSLNLHQSYLAEAIEYHLGLGLLAKQLKVLGAKKDGSEFQLSGDDLQRFNALISTFKRVSREKYGVSLRGENFEEASLRITEELMARHGDPSPAKCRQLEDLVDMSLEFTKVLRNPSANFTAFLARSSEVVAGTCVGIGRQGFGIVDHAYDWVIIDEAARSSATELAVAMQVGRRILLVGDHKQLPPAVQAKGFQRQLAEHLGVAHHQVGDTNIFKRAFLSSYGRQVGHTLRRQYRMASSIGTLVSDCFYKDTPLKNERDAPSHLYETLPSHFSKEVTWIDTSDRGKAGYEETIGRTAKKNDTEISVILNLLRGIAESPAFIDFISGFGADGNAIGVITMYAAQRDALRQKFDQADWAAPIRHLVSIGTVDSYQGKENRIIILSVVRNNSTGDVGFLSRPERINVAISRAMDRLFIVGATAMWRHQPAMPLHDVLIRSEQLAEEGRAAILPSRLLEA